MEILQELVYIINKNKLKSKELFNTGRSNNHKMLELYSGIANGQFKTNDMAAQTLYPNSTNSSAYNKLKFYLRNHLINRLFLLDIRKASFTDRQQAYYECNKNWAAARILLGKNAWKSCLYICRHTLKYAIKYEFTEIALDIIKMLRLNYGTREGNMSKFQKYNKEYQKYESIYLAENEAEVLYSELIVGFINNQDNELLKEKSEAFYQQIRPLMESYDSYKLHLYGNMIWMMNSSFINNHKDTLKVCEVMIQYFNQKPYQANTPLQIAYYQQLVCYCQLGMFKEGQNAAENCLKLIEEGHVNWFKYHELYFILALYTEQYEDAFSLYRKVVTHKRFSYLHATAKEIWTIYEAYIHYLYEVGLLHIPSEQPFFSKFRLGRFLNNTPIFSKDKQGMNIAILIIQSIFLMRQKKYGKVIDRIDAIKKYNNRYLRQKNTMRSYYFIKMLLVIPLSNFHKQAVIRKAHNAFQKLKSLPIEQSSQNHKVEIIPYERLWELILDQLDNSTHKKKREVRERDYFRAWQMHQKS